MKALFSFLLFFLFGIHGHGQEVSAELSKQWSETKKHFLKKGEEGKKIATIAMDSKLAKPYHVSRVLANANRLVVFAGEDVQLDSVSFHWLSVTNDSLNADIKVLFTELDADKQFALLKTYATFRLLYETAAKRVYVAKHDFNEQASRHKFPFFFGAQNTEMPRVKF